MSLELQDKVRPKIPYMQQLQCRQSCEERRVLSFSQIIYQRRKETRDMDRKKPDLGIGSSTYFQDLADDIKDDVKEVDQLKKMRKIRDF